MRSSRLRSAWQLDGAGCIHYEHASGLYRRLSRLVAGIRAEREPWCDRAALRYRRPTHADAGSVEAKELTAQVKDIPDEVIIDACEAFHGNRTNLTPEAQLADRWPVKVIMRKMERMVERGILDYGVSLRTAWVDHDWKLNRQKMATK